MIGNINKEQNGMLEISSGTIIFGNVTSPGCKLTIRLCNKMNKLYICNPSIIDLKNWII